MKKNNWKYFAGGNLVVLACATCLLLFTMLVQAAPAPVIHFGKELIKFDDLTDGSTVTSGYGFLNWNNFYALDAVNYDNNPSGYEAGIKSPNNVSYNGFGNPATISGSRFAFILNSAYLTAAWNDNLKLKVQGYMNGRLIYTRTYTLSAVKPLFITFPNQLVSQVVFTSSGGTDHAVYDGSGEHFAMDNVTVTILPVPVTVVN